MDAETMRILNEARAALQTVNKNFMIELVLIVVMVGAVAAIMAYAINRWSFIPRKKQNRVFIERF